MRRTRTASLRRRPDRPRGAPAGAPDRGAVHLHAHTATGVNPPRAPQVSATRMGLYGFTAS